MRTGEIASSAEYRMDKQFQNLPIFGISIVFQIEEILEIWSFSDLVNPLNFKFRKILKFLI